MAGRDLRPLCARYPPGLTCRVFIGTEIRLDVGFGTAQARLAGLARRGLLRRASDDAYRDLESGLARVGPLDAVPGLSRLVTVRFSDMTIHEDWASVAIRWEATGPGGALFPALDADITLSPAGDDATMITVAGVYRAPLGVAGRGPGPGDPAPGRRGDHPGLRPGHRGGHDRFRPLASRAAAA